MPQGEKGRSGEREQLRARVRAVLSSMGCSHEVSHFHSHTSDDGEVYDLTVAHRRITGINFDSTESAIEQVLRNAGFG
jgi:hypothetical protein